MWIYTFRNEHGDSIVWKTSKTLPIERNQRVHVRGTIKEHSEYKDEKQTILTRCKITELEDNKNV